MKKEKFIRPFKEGRFSKSNVSYFLKKISLIKVSTNKYCLLVEKI